MENVMTFFGMNFQSGETMSSRQQKNHNYDLDGTERTTEQIVKISQPTSQRTTNRTSKTTAYV